MKISLRAAIAITVAAAVLSGNEAPASSPRRNLRIDLPESKFQKSLISSGDLSLNDDRGRNNDALEISVSSWSPSGMRTTTNISNATPFRPASAPQIAVSYLADLAKIDRLGALRFKAGAGAQVLKREGVLQAGRLSQKVEQTLYLIPTRIGVELTPNLRIGRFISPFVIGSLLPSLAITSRSPLSEPTTDFGFPIEIGAGAVFSSPWTPVGLEGANPKLTTGLIMTAGSILDASLFGIGLQAGVQLSI